MSTDTNTAVQASPAPTTRYIPAADWQEYYPWPSRGGLRKIIFDRKTNGFDKVIKRIGRRILIDEAAFHQWVEEQDALTRETG